ncbi:hypothetical protein RJ640_030098 [Escallonia rubra]|uniref:Ubiquitin conjugation factor E4 core domain-containing protein n=1 Tax=Escallonia rubra TaxID=112253 RepID=A0AA88QHF3_9ASTE|nr:hypothetical protein RJ640_030098 [Escallonia rubra]
METYLNVGESLYFASNVMFRTLVDSWLVTMKMVAQTVAPKARSLSRNNGMLLALLIETMQCLIKCGKIGKVDVLGKAEVAFNSPIEGLYMEGHLHRYSDLEATQWQSPSPELNRIQFATREKKIRNGVLAGDPLDYFMNFIVVFMASPENIRNSYMRAKMLESLSPGCLLYFKAPICSTMTSLTFAKTLQNFPNTPERFLVITMCGYKLLRKREMASLNSLISNIYPFDEGLDKIIEVKELKAEMSN